MFIHFGAGFNMELIQRVEEICKRMLENSVLADKFELKDKQCIDQGSIPDLRIHFIGHEIYILILINQSLLLLFPLYFSVRFF